MVSEKKLDVIVSPPLPSFRNFSLSLMFCSLNIICLGEFLAFILCGSVWASWICELMSGIKLGEILSHYCFKYFLCSFLPLFFFWYPHFMYITPFYSCPTVLGYPGCSVFFLFAFPLSTFDLYPQAQRLFAQVFTLPLSPLKTFFIF